MISIALRVGVSISTLKTLVVLLIVVHLAADASSPNEADLHSHLFNNYSILTRPVSDLSDHVDIFCHISLTQLIEVNEKSQIIKASIWMYQTWTDPRLVWDELTYGGLKYISVPVEKIWVPDIALSNSASNEFGNYPRVHLSGLTVTISSDGNVTKITPMISETPCLMNIRYFPKDEQSCYLQFALWGSSDSLAHLQAQRDEVTKENYIPNMQWDVTSSQIKTVTKNFLGSTTHLRALSPASI
ncbi:acetylcholine receptor subunit alpha-L1-like [Ptychodera flava]|uniref:acetylcholine receptor subunit alpha-L1-like n=1 Tax=Ptychodera flava TaxID=63121 RepID=UPI00396A855F